MGVHGYAPLAYGESRAGIRWQTTVAPETAVLIGFGMLGVFGTGVFLYAKFFLIAPVERERRKRH